MFIQHADTKCTPRSKKTRSSCKHLYKKIDTSRKCQEDAHIKRDPFCFQFLKVERKRFKNDNFVQDGKYNTFIQLAYNTKFIQHVKYTLRWAFWAQV